MRALTGGGRFPCLPSSLLALLMESWTAAGVLYRHLPESLHSLFLFVFFIHVPPLDSPPTKIEDELTPLTSVRGGLVGWPHKIFGYNPGLPNPIGLVGFRILTSFGGHNCATVVSATSLQWPQWSAISRLRTRKYLFSSLEDCYLA